MYNKISNLQIFFYFFNPAHKFLNYQALIQTRVHLQVHPTVRNTLIINYLPGRMDTGTEVRFLDSDIL